MAKLWPFIQSLVKKWRLEGRSFTFGRLLLELAMDGSFLLLHHSNGVSNNILKKFFCRPNSFYTMAVYTEACVESQFLVFTFTVHAFYNVLASVLALSCRCMYDLIYPRLLHLLCLLSLLYLPSLCWLVFSTYLVYLPMAIATYVYSLLSLLCLYPCLLCLLVTACPYPQCIPRLLHLLSLVT